MNQDTILAEELVASQTIYEGRLALNEILREQVVLAPMGEEELDKIVATRIDEELPFS